MNGNASSADTLIRAANQAYAAGNLPLTLYQIHRLSHLENPNLDISGNLFDILVQHPDDADCIVSCYLEEIHHCSELSSLEKFAQVVYSLLSHDWNRNGAQWRGVTSFELKVQKIIKKFVNQIRPLLNNSRDAPRNSSDGDRIRVAHIVPQVIDKNHSPLKVIDMFLRKHQRDKFDPWLVVTDSNTYSKLHIHCRTSASSLESGIDFMERASKKYGVHLIHTEKGISSLERIVSLYHDLSALHPDVAVFHGNGAWVVDSILAMLKPAPFQIAFDLGAPMINEAIDLSVHCVRSAASHYKAIQELCSTTPVVLDYPVLDQGDLSELPKAEIKADDANLLLLVTAGNHLEKRMSEDFLVLVSKILAANPHVNYFILGRGSFAKAKGIFSAMGVLNRVVFAGVRDDVMSIFKSCHIYLNEFPDGGGSTVAEAMACGLPVVAMKSGDRNLESCGAEIIGLNLAIDGYFPDKYALLLQELIDSEEKRTSLATKLKTRYEKCTSEEGMTAHLEAIISRRHQIHPPGEASKESRLINELFENIYTAEDFDPEIATRVVRQLSEMNRQELTLMPILDLLAYYRDKNDYAAYRQIHAWAEDLRETHWLGLPGQSLHDLLLHQVFVERFVFSLSLIRKKVAMTPRNNGQTFRSIGYVFPLLQSLDDPSFILAESLMSHGTPEVEEHFLILAESSAPYLLPDKDRPTLKTPDHVMEELKNKYGDRLLVAPTQGEMLQNIEGFASQLDALNFDALLYFGSKRNDIAHCLAELRLARNQFSISFKNPLISPAFDFLICIGFTPDRLLVAASKAFMVPSKILTSSAASPRELWMEVHNLITHHQP